MAASTVDAVLIHAVYLLNCASEDRDIRAKSLTSLVHSLRTGRAIGASGVVLHPGSAKTGDVGRGDRARRRDDRRGARRQRGLRAAPREHRGRGRDAGTLASRSSRGCSRASGGGERLGVCLDSCHLFASGYDIRTPAGMASLLRECSRKLGRGRVRSLHLNDSQAPLGSNRDRHANVGEGELGERGCSAFLSAAGVQKLPCVLETPGQKRAGPAPRAEVELAMRLRERGRARAQRTASAARVRR